MTNASSLLRRLAALAVVVTALAFVLPPSATPLFHPTAATASSGGGQVGGGNNGNGGLTCPTGQAGCTSNVPYCKNGAGWIDMNGGSYLLYQAPWVGCNPGIHISHNNVSENCVVSFFVFDFYGVGNASNVDTYAVHQLNPARPGCPNGPAAQYLVYSPNPSDTGSSPSAYQSTVGTAWCGHGSLPSSPGAAPSTACVGYSPYSNALVHVSPLSQHYTTVYSSSVPGRVVNYTRTCSQLEANPSPIPALLANNSIVTNPWGAGTLTVGQAVRMALMGSRQQLGGATSAYDAWYQAFARSPFGGGTPSIYLRLAASVINDLAASSPSLATPTVGNVTALRFGDLVSCSSDAQYIAVSNARHTNDVYYGVCVVPVSQKTQVGTESSPYLPAGSPSYSFQSLAMSGGPAFLSAPAQPDNNYPVWRQIIYNDVLNNKYMTGSRGTIPGAPASFPWTIYAPGGANSVGSDALSAAKTAQLSARCYGGSAGSVISAKSSTVVKPVPAMQYPPQNAVVQVQINADPQYAATGGTYHPTLFSATQSPLLCGTGTTLIDCSVAYPGLYTLNTPTSPSWHLTLTSSDPSRYTQCSSMHQTGCQFYVQDLGPTQLQAYFFQATPPGVTLHLDAAVSGTGMYTIYAARTPVSGMTRTSSSITICGDGQFNGIGTGFSDLSCPVGVTLAPPATSSRVVGSAHAVETAHACPIGSTPAGAHCVSVLTGSTHTLSARTCALDGGTYHVGHARATCALVVARAVAEVLSPEATLTGGWRVLSGPASAVLTGGSTYPATKSYSCPSGWSGNAGSPTCSRTITGISKQSCLNNGGSWVGSTCVKHISATVSYTCNPGDSLSGTTCTVSSSGAGTPTTTNPPPGYDPLACPYGGTQSGSSCVLRGTATSCVSIPGGVWNAGTGLCTYPAGLSTSTTTTPVTTTTFPPPIQVPIVYQPNNTGNFQVIGSRDIIVIGAGSNPG